MLQVWLLGNRTRTVR